MVNNRTTTTNRDIFIGGVRNKIEWEHSLKIGVYNILIWSLRRNEKV
jgi:hypothetical protein